ncbi:MAG: hypothetical protein QXG58_06175 [Candidatus Bathyarchaeia archaeon]
MTEKPEEERLPVSEKVKVLRFQTLFKGERWWAAAGLFESFGRKHIALYLWFKRGNSWRRRQKFVFRSKEEWEKAKKAIESLAAEL